MGRNGKNKSVFQQMIEFVNANVGRIVTSDEILLGNIPGRNSQTAYLYKFIRLKYVEAIGDGFVMCKNTKYKIIKPFDTFYNSKTLMHELKIASGFIP